MYHSYVNENAEYQVLIIALNYLRPNNIKYIQSDQIRSSILPFIWYAAHINRSIKESDFNQIVNHLSFGSKIVKSNDFSKYMHQTYIHPPVESCCSWADAFKSRFDTRWTYQSKHHAEIKCNDFLSTKYTISAEYENQVKWQLSLLLNAETLPRPVTLLPLDWPVWCSLPPLLHVFHHLELEKSM